ncbi:hypothetical protein JCM8097_003520 [Rhodosporidiobolus ruineniae]
MNTLQYFLSTLRPAPPPSPRASTSELPIPVEGKDHLSPLDVPLPPDDDVAVQDDDEEEGRGDDHAAGGERAEPRPPPLRRASTRKGKARERPRSAVLDAPVNAVEDPLRDGATVRTELERGEGVEPLFAPGEAARGEQLPTPPPSPGLSPASQPGLDLEKASLLPSSSYSSSSTPPPAAQGGRPFPLLSRLAALLPLPLRLLTAPLSTLVFLIRRFLALFGLSSLLDPLLTAAAGGGKRPGWNALLAPPAQALVGALSTEGGGGGGGEAGDESEAEKGSGGAVTSRRSRILTVALRFNSSSPAPTSSIAAASRSRTPSPASLAASAPLVVPRPLPPAPPPKLTPKTLVLDLDETLIHSTSRPYGKGRGGRGGGSGKGLKTRVVEVVLEGRSTVYTVYKRPWVDFFLRKVSSWYTVVIFTASLPEYADPVIDWLDGGDGRGGMIGPRLFRADCLARNGSYVKDLSVVDPDLSRVCLVDNSPASYAVNQANGIPIEGWINDPTDECLLDLLPMLDSLRFTNDVRRVLGLRGFGRTGGAVGGGSMGVGMGGGLRMSMVGGRKQ